MPIESWLDTEIARQHLRERAKGKRMDKALDRETRRVGGRRGK